MKPILFNTEMVKAILDGRKTVTRRLIKPQPVADADLMYAYAASRKQDIGKWGDRKTGQTWNPPYHADDILYVREKWARPSQTEIANGADPKMYLYATDTLQPCAWDKWRPSIHMPKEAARIFLRVKSVRVERLKSISVSDAMDEGVSDWNEFVTLWDSTVPKHPNKFKSYPYYWKDNPWVWVIEFERISKEEALK